MTTDAVGFLKGEQTARIVLRDTTLYVHIASIIAIYAAEGQAGQNAALVDSIRASAIVLAAVIFSIYASNDFYISRIAHFCATHGEAGVQLWEQEHRKGFRYRLQKILRTLAILIVFPGWSSVQLFSVLHKGFTLLSATALLCWIVVTGATIVYLTADAGRTTSDEEAVVPEVASEEA